MLDRKAFIFGNGGHAGALKSFLMRTVEEIIHVTPDGLGDSLPEEDFFRALDDGSPAIAFLGIGDNRIRLNLFQRLRSRRVRLPSLVAPGATVLPGAFLGDGTVVFPGAVVMASARVGENCIVNTLSSVDHDCRIGSHSQLTAGVILGGGVAVGERCFLGLRSAILPNLEIGSDTVIMAGSLVTKSYPDGGLVLGGNPAAPARLAR